MENNNLDQLREEEIPNIEQFQVGRSPSPEEEAEQNAGGGGSGMQNAANTDAGYTDQEVQFADGKDHTERRRKDQKRKKTKRTILS